MVRAILLALVLAFCVAVPVSAGQVWDLVGDFAHTSNPNGAWTYGYSSTVDAAYAFSTYPECYEMTVFTDADWSNCWGYDIPNHGFLPALWFNPNSVRHGWIPANSCAGHPGYGPVYTVARWTAPDTGIYQVSMRVYADTGVNFRSLDMHVLLNNSIVPEAEQKCGVTYNRDGVYTADLNLVGGTTVDLAIGPDEVCDADAFLMAYHVEQMVPEPGSFAALATALVGFVGLTIRRRKA